MEQESKIVKLGEGHSLNTDLSELVRHYNLNHGDVITEDEDRFVFAKIVSYDESTNSYKLINNPDDSGSGYLTFPRDDVLASVNDFTKKFSTIIEESPCVNFYISRDDRFVTDRFGTNIPETFEFNVEYQWGGLESFYVRNTTQGPWKSFDFESATLEEMEGYFSTADMPKAHFSAKIELKGDDYEAYQKKYTTEGKYSWISAKPELPLGWDCETGGSHAGSDFRNWTWKFDGPSESKEAAIASVKDFLSGFDYQIEMPA